MARWARVFVPRLHWVTVSRHVLHCSLVVSSISCTQKSYHLFPLALGPPAFFCVFPTVVPSFTFPTAAPLLSFALLERNGRDNPEPSESCTFFYFYPPPTSFFCDSGKKWVGGIPPNFPKAVPSFTFTTPPFFFLLRFWQEMGGTTPNFPKFFTFLYLPARPPPSFSCFSGKKWGWATPNFLKVVPSFTYQLPPPPNSILPFEFLERNRRGNPFFFKLESKVWQVLHLQTCKDWEGGVWKE